MRRNIHTARLLLAACMVLVLGLAGCASTPAQAMNDAHFTTVAGLEAGKVSLEDAATLRQVMLAVRDAYVTGQVTNVIIAQIAFLTDDVQTSPTLLALIRRVLSEVQLAIDVPDFEPDLIAVATMDGMIDGAQFYIDHPPPGVDR